MNRCTNHIHKFSFVCSCKANTFLTYWASLLMGNPCMLSFVLFCEPTILCTVYRHILACNKCHYILKLFYSFVHCYELISICNLIHTCDHSTQRLWNFYQFILTYIWSEICLCFHICLPQFETFYTINTDQKLFSVLLKIRNYNIFCYFGQCFINVGAVTGESLLLQSIRYWAQSE